MKKLVCAGMAMIIIMVSLSSCSTMNKGNQSQSVLNKSDAKTPFLMAPKVRKVWVPEKIDGDKYIEGHWMWILERTTTWSQ